MRCRVARRVQGCQETGGVGSGPGQRSPPPGRGAAASPGLAGRRGSACRLLEGARFPTGLCPSSGTCEPSGLRRTFLELLAGQLCGPLAKTKAVLRTRAESVHAELPSSNTEPGNQLVPSRAPAPWPPSLSVVPPTSSCPCPAPTCCLALEEPRVPTRRGRGWSRSAEPWPHFRARPGRVWRRQQRHQDFSQLSPKPPEPRATDEGHRMEPNFQGEVSPGGFQVRRAASSRTTCPPSVKPQPPPHSHGPHGVRVLGETQQASLLLEPPRRAEMGVRERRPCVQSKVQPGPGPTRRAQTGLLGEVNPSAGVPGLEAGAGERVGVGHEGPED